MKNKTDITIILDRSGSMASVQDDTIGGFNSFLSEQQKTEGEAALSLVQFDDQYEIVYMDKEIHSADKLNDHTFQPRGSTALYTTRLGARFKPPANVWRICRKASGPIKW